MSRKDHPVGALIGASLKTKKVAAAWSQKREVGSGRVSLSVKTKASGPVGGGRREPSLHLAAFGYPDKSPSTTPSDTVSLNQTRPNSKPSADATGIHKWGAEPQISHVLRGCDEMGKTPAKTPLAACDRERTTGLFPIKLPKRGLASNEAIGPAKESESDGFTFTITEGSVPPARHSPVPAGVTCTCALSLGRLGRRFL